MSTHAHHAHLPTCTHHHHHGRAHVNPQHCTEDKKWSAAVPTCSAVVKCTAMADDGILAVYADGKRIKTQPMDNVNNW